MSPSHEINHVSDTALMVAACRALESECQDGFVQDPFASRLAGERGMAMLRALPRPEIMRFGIGVRSHFMDELLLQALASKPIATVLSVGCGLDTRPWRLELPPDLRWIEVDFADMLDYKDALMAAETPRCRRERIAADVNDLAQRRALYAAAGPSPAMMITEGLLMYLPAATVHALATEACQESGIAHWMADINTSAFAKAINMDTIRSVRQVQASDFLEGEQILDVVSREGWVTAARRSYLTDMAFAMGRIQRLMGDRPQPAGPPPVPPDDPTGVHWFARGEGGSRNSG
ncbi:MAG: class I SAM-dependent methyltransferase [Candidatus Sulfopaludibacter sp.]|nr:class I SAM-dependent methyltransferase [Candidatus Sulfopaludibacter sp.]